MRTPKRAPLRLLSLVVLLGVGASSVVLSMVARSIINDQEHRLLQERTSEGIVVLDGLFSGASSSLTTLVASSQPSMGATDRFTAAAKRSMGLATAIGAIGVDGGRLSVLASVGSGPAVGSPVAGERADLVRRALSATDVVTAVIETPAGRRTSMAVAAGNDLVAFQDLAFDPAKPFELGDDGPFSDMDGALYATRGEDQSALVFTTTARLPLHGRVDRQKMTVGADSWLLVVRSKHSLSGSFARVAPWFGLGAGLLAALLTTLLVETLLRRRAYALALVDERTFDLQQAREAAEAANRSKSEFLSRMSHELRTPLNAVLGFGQLLELDELTDDQRESVEQIVKGGRHLLTLINEVLDISRIDTGSLSLSSEPVRVGDVVGDTVSLMRALADHRDVRLVTALGGMDDAHVVADQSRLKQILLNLVANAVKYNHHAGRVTVSCEPAGDERLRIVVEDDGPGIRPEDFSRLFVPFERLGAERTEVEGTGVGLALSRRLAEAMGGTLDMSSTVGAGSRFWVELTTAANPLDELDRNVPAMVEQLAAPYIGSEDRTTVLYIEDNVANVRLVERILARRGDLDIIPAMQGRLGIELARQHRPAIILLDLHLPDMDGDEVLRQLRADPVTASTPVVMVSADATPGQIQRLLDLGASTYLTKPFDVDRMLAVLSFTLEAAKTTTTP